jgi:hypothetical protein
MDLAKRETVVSAEVAETNVLLISRLESVLRSIAEYEIAEYRGDLATFILNTQNMARQTLGLPLRGGDINGVSPTKT